jgi:hypothetical protein
MFWYISTPYSKYPLGIEQAYKDACEAATFFMANKIPVYCPIAQTHIADDLLDKFSGDDWLQIDLQVLNEAFGLLVIKMPGWETSHGVTVEVDFATKKNKPIIYIDWPLPSSIPDEIIKYMDAVKENPKDATSKDKLPLDLIPPISEYQVAMCLKHGADKYTAWNWRSTPIKLSRYIAAIKRHLLQVSLGNWIDPESGQPHVAHIAATCAILMDAAHHNCIIYDYPPGTVLGENRDAQASDNKGGK